MDFGMVTTVGKWFTQGTIHPIMGSMADNEQHRNDSPPPPRPLGQPTTVGTMMVCVVNNYTVVVVVVDNLRLPRVVEHLLSA